MFFFIFVIKKQESVLATLLTISSTHAFLFFRYARLYKISKFFEDQDDEAFLSHPWQRCFSRFLKSLPSCHEDLLLLNEVLVFLNILVPFYTKNCWVTSFLKESQRSLLDLICIDSSLDEDAKIVGQTLLKLVTTCVRKEQRFLEYYPPGEEETLKSSWKQVVKLIVQNLKSSGAQHFYNLGKKIMFLQVFI